MNQKTTYFLFFILLLTACSSTSADDTAGNDSSTATLTSSGEVLDESIDAVKITGTINGGAGQTLYFNQYQNSGEGVMTVIGTDDKFSINAPVDKIDFYKLYFSDKNLIVLVLDPKTSAIQVTANASALGVDYTVSGSKDSELMRNFFVDNKAFSIKKQELTQKVNTSTGADKERFNAEYMSELTSYVDKQKSIALANLKSPAALTIVSVLDPKDHMDTYNKVFEGLKDVIPHSGIYKSLQAEIKSYQTKMKQQSSSAIQVGTVAPDINLNDPNGKPISLSSLRGKYVLIDFWASWCGPCRKENPNVVRLYNQYKDKGFEIYGVSLDQNLEKWKGAIAADNLTWPHVSDLAGWKSSAAAMYGVRGIPHTVLLDKEGKVLATKLRGQSLALKLAELMD